MAPTACQAVVVVFYYSKVRISIPVTMQLHLSSLDQSSLSVCFILICCDTSIIKITWQWNQVNVIKNLPQIHMKHKEQFSVLLVTLFHWRCQYLPGN